MTQLQARAVPPFPTLAAAPCCAWCTYPCTPMDCANHRRTPATSTLLAGLLAHANTPTTQGANA